MHVFNEEGKNKKIGIEPPPARYKTLYAMSTTRNDERRFLKYTKHAIHEREAMMGLKLSNLKNMPLHRLLAHLQKLPYPKAERVSKRQKKIAAKDAKERNSITTIQRR